MLRASDTAMLTYTILFIFHVLVYKYLGDPKKKIKFPIKILYKFSLYMVAQACRNKVNYKYLYMWGWNPISALFAYTLTQQHNNIRSLLPHNIRGYEEMSLQKAHIYKFNKIDDNDDFARSR